MEHEAEMKLRYCAFTEWFNIQFVTAIEDCPVMYIFAIKQFIKPGWALHVTMF